MPISNSFNSILKFLLLKRTKNVIIVEAIEIRNGHESHYTYNAIIVCKKNSTVTITDSIIQASINRLSIFGDSYTKRNIPVLLIINSDKILHKLTHTSQLEVAQKDLHSNIDLDDFCEQQIQFESNTVISIIRKQNVQEILTSLPFNKEAIIHISVGPFAISTTYKLICEQTAQDHYYLELENYSFTFSNDSLTNFSISPYSVNVGSVVERSLQVKGEMIRKELFISFSQAVNYFLNPLVLSGIVKSDIDQARNNYYFKKASQLFILYSAGILLTLLLISSIFFTIYSEKYNHLQLMYQRTLDEKKAHDIEQNDYKQYLQVMHENNLNEVSTLSYYSDQITSTIPPDVYLNILKIFPESDVSIDDNISFDKTRIIIEGNCYSNDDLNIWIDILSKMVWCEKVFIKEYKQPNDEEIGSYKIELIKRL